MNRNSFVLLAAGGSFLLLAGAFLFQVMGFPPCAMCIWQRWPHVIAVVIGVLALRIPGPVLPSLGAISAHFTAIIGLFHTGVERDWWEGPTSCTGSGNLTGDLLSTDGPRLVMCDQVSWELFTLSMASWNMLFSACLVVFWLIAARR